MSWFISRSCFRRAVESRRASELHSRRNHIGEGLQERHVEGSGRHHGDDDKGEGGGKDEPL